MGWNLWRQECLTKRSSPLPLVARLAKAMRFCSRLIAGVRAQKMDRREALSALVEWRGELGQLRANLQRFPWDAEDRLLTLTPGHICRALERYLRGEVSEADVEAWADAVEGREDLEYLSPCEERISEALFQLSTPGINAPINRQTAERWQRELSAL